MMDGILDAVEGAGPLGAPAGTIYIALQTMGCSFDQYSGITEGMVKAGLMTSKGHLFRITDKGREWLKTRTPVATPAPPEPDPPIAY
jgi:hypothetical protein